MSHRRPHIGIKSRPATGREREGDLLKEANELPRNSARLEPTWAHVAKDLVQVKAELHKSTKRNVRLSEDIKALKDELGRVGGAFEEDITCPICSSVM